MTAFRARVSSRRFDPATAEVTEFSMEFDVEAGTRSGARANALDRVRRSMAHDAFVQLFSDEDPNVRWSTQAYPLGKDEVQERDRLAQAYLAQELEAETGHSSPFTQLLKSDPEAVARAEQALGKGDDT